MMLVTILLFIYLMNVWSSQLIDVISNNKTNKKCTCYNNKEKLPFIERCPLIKSIYNYN